MSRIKKSLVGILLGSIIFGISAFTMYKYNEFKNLNDLASKGKQYMVEKDYDKAIQVFQQALSYKNDIDIEKNLVLAQSLKNENTKKDIISKNIQLANEAAKNNKYDEANKYLDEIFKVEPNNSDAKNLKDIFAKSIQDQQEKVKAQEEKKNIENQQKYKNANSQEGVTQQQAHEIVSNKFKDSDVFMAKRSDYSNEIAEQAGNRYYLFYTESKLDHSATDHLIGVDKKTGMMYAIYGYQPMEKIN